MKGDGVDAGARLEAGGCERWGAGRAPLLEGAGLGAGAGAPFEDFDGSGGFAALLAGAGAAAAFAGVADLEAAEGFEATDVFEAPDEEADFEGVDLERAESVCTSP